jgi:phosphoglycolate phosphatase
MDGNTAAVQAVLFDKDGTLIDSLGPWAEAERLICVAIIDGSAPKDFSGASRAKAVADALAAVGVHDGVVDKSGILARSGGDVNLETLRRSLARSLGGARGCLSGAPSFAREFSRILHLLYPKGMPPFRPMPGADEALRALAEAGIPLGLSTADDRAPSLRQLEAFGWLERFVFLSFGDTALRPKPDPWAVLEFARLVCVEPGSVAVVGDTASDRGMAFSAGAGVYLEVSDSLSGIVPRLLAGKTP